MLVSIAAVTNYHQAKKLLRSDATLQLYFVCQ
jgi:hypothetical protein